MKKTPEEIAADLNQRMDGFKELIEKSATKEALVVLEGQIKEYQTKSEKAGEDTEEYQLKMDDLTKLVTAQAAKIKKITPAGFNVPVTLASQIEEQLKGEAFQDYAVKRKGKGDGPTMQLKDISWIGTGQVGEVVQNYMPFQVPIYPDMEMFNIYLLVALGTSSEGSIDYPKEKAYVNEMNNLLETTPSTKTEITFEMVTENAKRTGTHANVSRRALRNTPWLAQYLAGRFMEWFIAHMNTQIIAGDGIAENFDGILSYAPDYALATALQNIIPAGESSLLDAVIALKSQLKSTTNIVANVLLVSSITATQLLLQKSTTREWLQQEPVVQVTENGMTKINGMLVVESNDVTVGAGVVGYFGPTSIQLFNNGGIDLSSTEYHDKNFTSNLVTFRFEADQILCVYKETAFLQGVLATVQGDITAA